MKNIECPIICKTFSVTKSFTAGDSSWLSTGLGKIEGYIVIGGYAYSSNPTWVHIISEYFPSNIGYKCIVTGPNQVTIAGKVIYIKEEYYNG